MQNKVVTEVGLVSNHLIPVQQALDKVYSVPVVERIKLKMRSNNDNNLGKIYKMMQSTRQLQNKGLSHWVASSQKKNVLLNNLKLMIPGVVVSLMKAS